MDDLIAFLNARLDEEEAAAVLAGKYNPAPWATDDLDDLRDATGAEIFAPGGYEGVSFYDSAAKFVACHDPARVLREVAARRAILAAWQAVDAEVVTMLRDRRPRKYGEWDGLHEAVCHLAAVYSGHPDYDPEWVPATASAPT